MNKSDFRIIKSKNELGDEWFAVQEKHIFLFFIPIWIYVKDKSNFKAIYLTEDDAKQFIFKTIHKANEENKMKKINKTIINL
tara:strand:- start:1262 stop:1507 length:246 start_codon:yes stop_codon:yes gene_type:complete